MYFIYISFLYDVFSLFFFFKQKTAYEMRISDWSSDVCSSDLFRNFIQENTWKEDKKAGTGTLYNLGSHQIDEALFLFGMPDGVWADLRVMRTGGKVVDYFNILLRYPDKSVILRCSYLVKEEGPRIVLHGTDGSYVKYGIDPQEERLKAGHLPEEANWGYEDDIYWGTINRVQKNGRTEIGRASCREEG